MGTTLREIVEEIGGGVPNGRKFKAAQTGGPSGGCIPAALMDTLMDYDSLLAIGSMMGSGGLIVMDDTTCMVDIAKFFLEFTVKNPAANVLLAVSVPSVCLKFLKNISGNGTMEDLDRLEELCYYIKENALCGLGQTAPNPVLPTPLRYYRDEYVAHVTEHRCPPAPAKRAHQLLYS